MRKALSIILAAVMLLSMVYIGASAVESNVGKVAAGYTPEGTGIATFEGITDAAGKYYLTADITVAATYADKFTGTFDGNGHTITTTVPLFADMSGVFKNAIIKGTIAPASGYAAAVSINTTGTALFENVRNDAKITGESTTGGIVGYCKSGSAVTVKGCENNGEIESKSQTGGIVGYSQGITLNVENCVNNGLITPNSTYGAGIVGRFGKDASTVDYICTIKNCVNNGKVNNTKDQAGGIIGYVVGIIEIDGCTNNGEITTAAGAAGGIIGQTASSSDKVTTSGAVVKNSFNYGTISGTTNVGGVVGSMGRRAAATTYQVIGCGNYGTVNHKIVSATAGLNAGGVVGYAWGGSTQNGIYNCFNVGEIKVASDSTIPVADQTGNYYIAGILGYFNSATYAVKDCFNSGKITLTDVKTGDTTMVRQLYFQKSADGSPAEFIANNYALEVEGAVYETNGTQPASYKTFKAEDLASGKLCYDINTAAGKTLYRQTLGTDNVPTTNAKAKEVLSTQTGYANESTPATGDGAVYYVAAAVVAMVALFGTAYVSKKVRAK